MGIRIMRADESERGKVTLSVHGSLTTKHMHLLDAECSRVLAEPTTQLCIDLKELNFLDEAGAALLARLKQRPGVCLQGNELFTREMIDSAKKESSNRDHQNVR